MKFWSNSFTDGGFIPGEFALCVVDPVTHVTLSANRNPHLAWSDVPAGARSLALVCHDSDAPSRRDDVNQEGKTVPPDLPRAPFFHWVLIDLPADMRVIEAGAWSNGVTSHGKPGPEITSLAQGKARHGINDYTNWFADVPEMAGDYYGYDGPCPPWNDSVIHRYTFTVYALDIERLPVDGRFNGTRAWDALSGHVLDKAEIVGIYTLNPALSR